MNTSLEDVISDTGERIHKILNNSVNRKLTVEEYKSLISSISSMLRNTRAAGQQSGRDEAIDVIEAEGEWVKEDVHDGNYGYFRADQKLLESARTVGEDISEISKE